MLVSGINWSCNWVQVITITGTYTCPMEERDDDFYFRFKNQWHPVNTCPMEERDDDFYFRFKNQWHPVSEYAHEDLEAEIKSHKQGAHQNRDYISQDEFEEICEQVLSRRSNITDYWFEEPGIVHVSYPSHSGKSKNGSTLFFGESGYITYHDWACRAGSNEGFFIGEAISRKIQSALYD